MIYQRQIKPSSNRNSLAAFTLIELLVVVAIIALLVAILLPSLNQAREIACEVVCAHNTKQWALAFLLYDTNYGILPGANRPIDPGGLQASYQWTLGPYLGYDMDDYADDQTGDLWDEDIPDIWTCPAAVLGGFNYAVNWSVISPLNPVVVGGIPSVSIDEVRRPAQTLVLVESLLAGVNIPFAYAGLQKRPDWDYDRDGLPASNFGYDTNRQVYDAKTAYYGVEYPYNGIGARHGDRIANVAFLDGHADGLHISELMDPTRRLWNEERWD